MTLGKFSHQFRGTHCACVYGGVHGGVCTSRFAPVLHLHARTRLYKCTCTAACILRVYLHSSFQRRACNCDRTQVCRQASAHALLCVGLSLQARGTMPTDSPSHKSQAAPTVEMVHITHPGCGQPAVYLVHGAQPPAQGRLPAWTKLPALTSHSPTCIRISGAGAAGGTSCHLKVTPGADWGGRKRRIPLEPGIKQSGSWKAGCRRERSSPRAGWTERGAEGALHAAQPSRPSPEPKKGGKAEQGLAGGSRQPSRTRAGGQRGQLGTGHACPPHSPQGADETVDGALGVQGHDVPDVQEAGHLRHGARRCAERSGLRRLLPAADRGGRAAGSGAARYMHCTPRAGRLPGHSHLPARPEREAATCAAPSAASGPASQPPRRADRPRHRIPGCVLPEIPENESKHSPAPRSKWDCPRRHHPQHISGCVLPKIIENQEPKPCSK